jgi:isoleucyl-tRNA synthetase
VAEPSPYRDTLNLPRTGFPMKADLVNREPAFLRRWESTGLYAAMRAARAGRQTFLLHDGPPYANNPSHLGHLLNNVLKDAVIRYKFLRGYDVPFTPGWDCHGQPIEHQYLKSAGLSARDVDPLELRRACAAYAAKWVRHQREERKRVGAVGDWDRPYLTMDNALVAAEIEAVGRLIRAGYIFRGKKPVLWCWSCETALAENAVEFGPHVAPSVYVRFPVDRWPGGSPPCALPPAKPVSVVIWTTTPWTLPANVAVAFHPRLSYDLVETDTEVLVLASELAAGVLALAGIRPLRTLATVEGRSLEGLACRHPFVRRTSVGILAEYVTLEAGTGVVHIAPGHGDEDFASGTAYRLPVLAPVDERGRFTAEFPEFEGEPVLEASGKLIERLASKGALLHQGVIEHAYPFCWRCKNPVIFRATEQWFISLAHDALKARAAEAARRVQWYPPGGGERLARMIEQRPDWCISRQRAWGVPIPVFYCEACRAPLATEASVRAVRDWVASEGADVWWRRDAAALLPAGTRCESCGGRSFRKETDTLDVWFDSGVTHTSVLRAREGLRAPADLYLEAHDQFRGWFQSSLLTSVALHGEAPYRAVLVHGWVLDPEGEKMSKSRGNVVSLADAVGRWGADVCRLWGLSEDFTTDVAITTESLDRIQEAYRKFRNTLRYLLGNLADWNGAEPGAEAARPVDRWMRGRIQGLVRDVTADFDAYRFHHGIRKLHQFCVVDLSAVYLEILKDRLYASRPDDPARRAAQAVLGECFGALVRMLAPVLPFTAEDAWDHAPAALTGGRRSVHLTEWPEAAPAAGAEAGEWDRLLAFREVATKALEEARQTGAVPRPLEAAVTVEADGEWRTWLEPHAGQLAEWLVVSAASLGGAPSGAGIVETAHGRLRISAAKARGAKCARCWLIRPEVGSVAGRPDVCARCADVLAARA